MTDKDGKNGELKTHAIDRSTGIVNRNKCRRTRPLGKWRIIIFRVLHLSPLRTRSQVIIHLIIIEKTAHAPELKQQRHFDWIFLCYLQTG